MIFVTVGSQKFQFNRLLQKIDQLIEKRMIKEDVFAQIGASDYKPQYFEYAKFMTQDEFMTKIDKANLVITHAGTGTIINSLKKGKKVIATPRLSKYGEHVDDHQIQLVNEFSNLNLIEPVFDIRKLEEAIQNTKNKKYDKYISNTNIIIDSINNYIKKN